MPVEERRRPQSAVIHPTKSPAEIATLPCLHIEGLRLEDILKAFGEDRRER